MANNVKFCTECPPHGKFWERIATGGPEEIGRIEYYDKEALTRYGIPDRICPKCRRKQVQESVRMSNNHSPEIRHDKPVPENVDKRKYGHAIYPYKELEIGQSFFVLPKNGESIEDAVNRMKRNGNHYKKKYDMDFVITQDIENGEKGVGVWRVK